MAKRGYEKIIENEDGLTDKKLRFIDFYFGAGNFEAMKAARMAGFSEAHGHKLLLQPEVKAEVERRRAKLRKEVEIDEKWVVQRLARIADASLGDILLKLKDNGGDLKALTPEERYALAEVKESTTENHKGEVTSTLQVKAIDKIAALVAIGRKLGLFKDNVNVNADELVARLNAGRERARGKVDGGTN